MTPIMSIDLDIRLLRSFVAVVDSGSVTAAAARIGCTQPAVSQNIQRLEALLDRQLLIRDRTLRLTEDGQALLPQARHLVVTHDALLGIFKGGGAPSRLRLGLPDAWIGAPLDRALDALIALLPNVRLDLVFGVGDDLTRRFEQGQLDLILVERLHGTESASDTGLFPLVWPLVWAAAPGFWPGETTLPLVLLPEGCLYRQAALTALTGLDRVWKAACVSTDWSGLLAAVRAGLGITVLPRSRLDADLHVLDEPGLPRLPSIAPAWLRSPVLNTPAGDRLVACLSAALAGRPDRTAGDSAIPEQAALEAIGDDAAMRLEHREVRMPDHTRRTVELEALTWLLLAEMAERESLSLPALIIHLLTNHLLTNAPGCSPEEILSAAAVRYFREAGRTPT